MIRLPFFKLSAPPRRNGVVAGRRDLGDSEAASGGRVACPPRRPATVVSHVIAAGPVAVKDVCHYGNSDLCAYEPSSLELHLAGRVVMDRDMQAYRDLRRVAQSRERARKVVELVRKEAAAQGMLGRIA